ncbi:SDR family oxidoreductase [Arenibaculum sp.]|uniref:SDR family oxidoreductase n=1 Tax=Arenibaculum sp. TaxID=2865862 RepID=UPI002E147FBF|nr:SDR family oxidoreductase [Arenibaculum sp.]
MKPEPVVAITGASAGVGRATALAFAEQGAQIGLIARDRDALETVRAEVERIGGRAIVLPADVADPEAVFDAADRIERELGPLDVWVNSAMATVFGMSWDITPEELRRVTEVTYLGGAHGVLAALRHMRPRNRGAILQVGSALAYRSIPAQAAYCAAKAAIRGYVDSVRVELMQEGSGITVTSVHLPAVNTPQFDWARCHLPNQPRPVAPVFQPEDIARDIVAAAEHPRREYWIGNMTRVAILGTFAAPGIADRYLAASGIQGQQTGEPLRAGRRDNLFETVPGLHRMRGRFSEETKPGPASMAEGMVRGALALAGLAVLGVGASMLIARERD